MRRGDLLCIRHATFTSALGRGRDAAFASLLLGESGLKPQLLDDGFSCEVGRVAGVEDVRLPAALGRYDCRNNRLAALALETDGFAEAVARSVDRFGASAVGVVVGTSTSGIATTEAAFRGGAFAKTHALPAGFPYRETHNVFSCADFTRRYLALKGPALVISTACSSSAKAYATAARLIQSGVCRAVVVGGVDSLCDTTLYGFRSLGLLSSHKTRPFSADRDGISIGEAGGFALLTTCDPDHSADMILAGVGDSADAYHMTAPHPEGLGAWEAMAAALYDADCQPQDIDYVHLHGTGTIHNDAAEDVAILKLGCRDTPVSSTKGATGHTLGAAGACAVGIAALAMEKGFIPGTVNTKAQDPLLHTNLLLVGRQAKVRRVLVNTFGFGGSNCSLVLEAPS